MKRWKKGVAALLICGMVLLLGLAGCSLFAQNMYAKKPVLYLYPEQQMDVRVKLDYKGN